MEIKVITAFMAHGKRVEAGEVIDLPVADAAYAVGLKRAEYIEAEAAEPIDPLVIKLKRKAKAE